MLIRKLIFAAFIIDYLTTQTYNELNMNERVGENNSDLSSLALRPKIKKKINRQSNITLEEDQIFVQATSLNIGWKQERLEHIHHNAIGFCDFA
ncbi:hypothetical protein BpHYR1_040604 [Brachionus plicatilis]|uniref:Uncharacterized protein n=1 Tax=Brachionus plicatilis TaxID=10195 RepID=A0A3M7P4T9_BRAPC|nr:hypothetical protein BpHYR1_040604 [Brachionus plicatilis]